MRKSVTYVASVAGAAALVGTVLTGAMASRPGPFHASARLAAKTTNINGDLHVKGVLRVQKNNSVYGKLYAHGGEQVWQGLLIHSGGVKSDSLDVAGPAQMQSATVAGNLQAGAITGTSLNVSGAVTFGAGITSGGKVTANGVDAGATGLTTSGPITGAAVNASSITDSGTLAAGSIASTGAITTASLNSSGAVSAGSVAVSGPLTAGSATFGGIKATGTVDLSQAQLTLPANAFNLNGQTITSLNVSNTMNLGTTAGSVPPLTIAQNGGTAIVGADNTGNLTTNGLVVKNLSVTSGFTLAGAGTLSVSSLTGAPASGTNTPGALSIQGSTITLGGAGVVLNANTSLNNGSDLNFNSPTGSNSASHLTATNNGDVAGLVAFQLVPGQQAGTEATPATITFNRPYKSLPIVVVTPMGINGQNGDPAPGSPNPPKVWVTILGTTGNYTGFTVRYTMQTGITTGGSAVYGYQVMGS